MGAFCVFGISKTLCRSKAEKKTPTIVGIGADARHLSIEEWADAVRAEAKALFLTEKKAVKISPEFDSPHFCRDWIAVAPSEVRMACVMVRAEKLDKKGKVVTRKGVPVLVWSPYEPPARKEAGHA